MYIIICNEHVRATFRTKKSAYTAFKNWVDFLWSTSLRHSCCRLYKVKTVRLKP